MFAAGQIFHPFGPDGGTITPRTKPGPAPSAASTQQPDPQNARLGTPGQTYGRPSNSITSAQLTELPAPSRLANAARRLVSASFATSRLDRAGLQAPRIT